ncbi:MAG: ATP-dependent helicase [Planctomycetota bacterium]
MQLNPDQAKAAHHDGGHLLVLAGAGTGKTRTIIARAAHLISIGVDPKRILALTFTRRSAGELVGRLKTQVGPAAEEVRAGTFHAFCLNMMRHFPKAFGLDQLTVLDRDDQLELVGMVRAGFVQSQDKGFPKRERITELLSYSRNTNVGFEEYLKKLGEFKDPEIEKLKSIYRAYESRKRLRSYLDYDDILYLFARTLHRDSMQDVRRMIAGGFDHILVDEMQDTNPIQWLILDGLRDPAKLYCVGDDAQSIYAFRGADFENVHSFTTRVKGGSVLPLITNYRSTQPILDLANWLLAQSPLNYEKRLESARGTGMKPKLIEFDSPAKEAAWVVQDVMEKRDDGMKLKEMMILVRAAWMTRDLEAALIENQVDYEFIGGTKLMQTAHVKDLLALLRSAISHRDELGWSRYLRLFNRVGDVTANLVIDQVSAMKSPEQAIEMLPDILAGAGKIPDSEQLVLGLVEIQKNRTDPETAMQSAVQFLNPIQKKRYDNWQKRYADYELLITLAKRHKSLEAFLETYTLDPVSATFDSRSEHKDILTLITVHSAKGTECKVGYVMKVQAGVYPHSRSLDDLAAIEEERRILYVALTRAKDELILTKVAERFGSPIFFGASTGRVATGGTSDFMAEYPPELVNYEMHGFQPSPFEDLGPIIARFKPEDN